MPPPPLTRRIFETVHLTSLGLWLGAVLATGLFAAVVFGASRHLDPTVPAFAAYEGNHADLVAGFIQNQVFMAVDAVQFVAAFLTLASLIGLLTFGKLPLNRWSSGLRVLGVAVAMGLVSYYLMVLTPRMTENVRIYWAAAEAGEAERASEYKAKFDEDHPAASNTLKGVAGSLALAMVTGAFSAASGGIATPGSPRKTSDPVEPNKPKLEEPDLVRKGARA
ncbi:MAG: DUF4149 domain-containing protein [Planctomycetota bacterium]